MKQPTDSAFKLIEYLAAKGMSEAAIAGCIGVSPRVFIEWKDRYPELMERLRIGQAHGVNLASEVVYRRMQLGDLTAAIFYLKKVDHWRDNGPTEAQVSQAPSALDAALSRLTPDEFNALTEIVSRGAGRAIVAGTAIIVGGAVQAEPA